MTRDPKMDEVPYPAYDERAASRAGHRQEAMDALWCANQLVDQAEDDDVPPDWEHVRYFQRDAQLHALLALSAGDA